MAMDQHVTIRSYPKVWDIENRVYSIMNLRLPRPVEPRAILYYGAALAVVLLLCRLLPFLRGIPWILLYLVLPGGAAYLLMKKKLDGKNPIRFIAALLLYLTRKHQFVYCFAYYTRRRRERVRWYCRGGDLKEGGSSCAPMSD